MSVVAVEPSSLAIAFIRQALRCAESRVAKTMIDTDDRKQAQRELQQLVDAVPQHIVVLYGDGRRLYANKAVLDYHNLTLEEFLVEPISNCFHPEDLEKYSRLRDSGIAIVVFSTEPETVLSLADRVLVMRKGEIAHEFAGEAISKDQLLAAA